MNNKTIAKKAEVIATKKQKAIDVNFKAKQGYIPNAVVTLLTTEGANKLPAQAQCFIQALANADNYTATINDLCVGKFEGDSLVYNTNFKTVQTALKVFNHYRQDLADKGFIELS